jgi:protein-L-isoaspartate(D-aspartate) O-methyltransferase
VTHSFPSEQPHEAERKRALLDQLCRQGIENARVLDALDRIPRSLFVEPELAESAWDNTALAIPHRQTISQPFVVALMTQALDLTGSERVLEIGTGSGYQAAVLALLAREVVTVERIPSLAEAAAERLEGLGIRNVLSIVGDGSAGWEPGAPYDAIMVTAGAREIPPALIEQLSESNGRMVIPVGPADDEHLRRLRKQGSELTSSELGAVRFVPLIVDDGNRGSNE